MGVVEHAQQPVGRGQVDRLAQARQRLLAAAVEHPGAQAEQLDVQAPLLQLTDDLVGTRERLDRASPRLRGDRGVAVRDRSTPSMALTPKEREVLELLARNLSNKEIGLAMQVGEETIKWHLKNLFGKLAAGNRKQVVRRAELLGLLETA